jgi:hypothetical protein
MNNAQEVTRQLHSLRVKEKKVFEVELDSVIYNAQQCWAFLFNDLRDKHNKRLIAPNIAVDACDYKRVLFSWKKDNYFLFLEVKNHAEIYAEYGEGESIFTRQKTYLRLDNFSINEIEDTLLLFTEEETQ